MNVIGQGIAMTLVMVAVFTQLTMIAWQIAHHNLHGIVFPLEIAKTQEMRVEIIRHYRIAKMPALLRQHGTVTQH